MTDASSELSDDIVPLEPQHSSLERNFAPWHKVRKEFIRKEQWNKLIIRYAVRYLKQELQEATGNDVWSADDDVKIPNSILIDRPLKCLVIPGDDLLDIRSLHRDTEGIQCYIRYLGFNYRQGSEQPNTRVHIAHNDVTSSHRVTNDSIVLPDLFQMVAKQNSQAYQYVKQLGPFHVVNLDLCDSLFPNKETDIQACYDGLHSITAYQMKEMAMPWLLFITTEVAPREVNPDQFDKLCNPTKTNMKHESFRDALATIVPKESLDPNQQVDLAQLDDKQLVDLFGVAIGKALLSFCSSAGATWKLEMRGSHTYCINLDKGVSMLSLAFQFTPISQPPQDATGISTLKLNLPAPFDEAELAIKLVASVQKIKDVDTILKSDVELLESLLASSADLLESAGYERTAYIQWVHDGELPVQ